MLVQSFQILNIQILKYEHKDSEVFVEECTHFLNLRKLYININNHTTTVQISDTFFMIYSNAIIAATNYLDLPN